VGQVANLRADCQSAQCRGYILNSDT